MSGKPASRAIGYSVSNQRSGGISDHSSVLTMPCGISAMFGVGGVAACRRDRLRDESAGAARRAAQDRAPSRTGGPAAGRTGLRNRIPAISTPSSAMPRPSIASNGWMSMSSSRRHSRAAASRDPREQGVGIDLRQASVADDDLPGDDDIADRPGTEPEHPVGGQRGRVDRCRRRVVQHDDVGRRAGLEPAEERLSEAAAGDAAHPGRAGRAANPSVS